MLYTLSKGTVSFHFAFRNLDFLNFIGRLFHKTLPLKFDESIPYFSECLRLQLRGNTPSPFLVQVCFQIRTFQWLGNANAFDESSVYYQKLRVHHNQPCLFIFKLNIQINGQQANWLSMTEQAKILAFFYVGTFLSLPRAYSS